MNVDETLCERTQSQSASQSTSRSEFGKSSPPRSQRRDESTEHATLKIEGLKKSFHGRQVLSDVTMALPRGCSMVIIGGSGSGKSVLLKCILGLLRPDAGSVLLDGEETVGLSLRQRERLMQRVGMLFQGGALFDSLSVWENITFNARQMHPMPRAQAIELAAETLGKVGLKREVAFLQPAQLSGGMQKRVSLARTICGNPEILFFDEPTTGLDPIMAQVINELIVSLCQELGATAITITHDIASARTIGDQIAMLYQGALIWQGSAETVMSSGNSYVDQFVHGRAQGPITSG